VSVLANAVVVTVGRHDVIAIAPYAVPVAVAVGTAVVIGAVVYKVSRIQFGRTRTPTMIAYLPRPGSVQASPIAGGTTNTIPSQIPIPTILMSKGGKQNITNEYVRMVRERVQQTHEDPCKILRDMYDSEKDSQERQKIYTALKALGCQQKRKR